MLRDWKPALALFAGTVCLFSFCLSSANAGNTELWVQGDMAYIQATDGDDMLYVSFAGWNDDQQRVDVYSTNSDADTVNGNPIQGSVVGTFSAIYVDLGEGKDQLKLAGSSDDPIGFPIDFYLNGSEGSEGKSLQLLGAGATYGSVQILASEGKDWIRFSQEDAFFADTVQIATRSGDDVVQFFGGYYSAPVEIDLGVGHDRAEIWHMSDTLDFADGIMLKGNGGSDTYDFRGVDVSGPVLIDANIENARDGEDTLNIVGSTFRDDFRVESTSRVFHFFVWQEGDYGWIDVDESEILGDLEIFWEDGRMEAEIYSLTAPSLHLQGNSPDQSFFDDEITIAESQIGELRISVADGGDTVSLSEVTADFVECSLGSGNDSLVLNSNDLAVVDFAGDAGTDNVTTDGDNEFGDLNYIGFETQDIEEDSSAGMAGTSQFVSTSWQTGTVYSASTSISSVLSLQQQTTTLQSRVTTPLKSPYSTLAPTLSARR